MEIDPVTLTEQDKKDFDHGKLLLERGNVDEAAGLFMGQLNKRFADPVILFYLGCCFLVRKQYGMAANCFRSGISYQKDFPEALQNLGACFRASGDHKHAEEIFNAALLQAKTDRFKAEVLGNIAGLYGNNGTPQKALDLYAEAMKFDGPQSHLLYNTGFCHLEMGNWAEGFRLYNTGFHCNQRIEREYPKVKVWSGESLKDKRVIVWGDQGLGDEILFASCIPDLLAEAKEVIFDCHPRMVRMWERTFPISCYGTRKTSQVEWIHDTVADISIAVTQLMEVYRKDGVFPRTPFLKAETPKTRATYPLKVGISWKGGMTMTRGELRSMTLNDMLPILSLPDIEFYSLQYHDDAAIQCAKFEEETGIHIRHYPGKVQCTDFATTVDFVNSLDLVVTVCTTIMHVAGALDVPCFVMTPEKAPWVMGQSGEQNAFYRSLNIYRQSPADAEAQKWGSVMDRIVPDIKRFQIISEAAE